MKINRMFWGISCALTVMAVALAGCGASKNAMHMTGAEYGVVSSSASAAMATTPMPSEEMAAVDDMASPEMASDMASNMQTQDAAEPAVRQDRKLVKHSDMQLQTKEFDTAVTQISAMIEQAGGYIESQQISGRGMDDPIDRGTARSAYINARIPADRLDEISGEIGGVCNVLSQSERIEDISEQYFDAQARLKSLMLQEERLLEILGKAEKLEEVITLESALSNVRYEIETLTASMRRMDSQVQYSFLNLSLNEVVNYQRVNDLPRSFGDRMALALENSGTQVIHSMQNTLIHIVENGPVFLWTLLIWAVVLVVAVKLAQLILRLLGVKHAFVQGRLFKHRVAKTTVKKASEIVETNTISKNEKK